MKGIVLKTTPFKETGKVVKIFTQEIGIVSFLLKKIPPTNHLLQTLSSSLAFSEFHLEKRQSDLYLFHDATLINPFIGLRDSYDKLSSGYELLTTISKSQFPEKPAPALFQLLIVYLKKLETASNPLPIVLSFILKTLFHDGLLPSSRSDFPPVTDEEWFTIKALLESKDFDPILALNIEKPLETKIRDLFKSFLELV